MAARKFNAPILNHVTRSEDFPTLKSVCEGRELPAYEAAEEFISRTAGELDGLLSDIGGDKGGLNTLEKLEAAEKQAQEKLSDLLDMLQRTPDNKELEQSVIHVANQAESKRRQVEAVGKMIDASAAGNQETISALVAQAVQSAAEKAEEVRAIIGAWSDEPGNLERNEVNEELLAQVRKSDVLKSVAKYLGRFREIFAQGKRNGYAYGRGEKYSLELENDISKALTSELAMLEITAVGRRNFALVHFSSRGRCQTDLFRPSTYAMADKMKAAETFLNGGTNFETPMWEALRLMREEGFENADIVFITDGQCGMPEHFLDELQQEQMERRFTITGVLLDSGSPDMDFSTSELTGEDIVRELVGKRV